MKFFFSNQILDTDTRELSRENMPISLEPQVFDLVVHLMENRDRVVSKEELIDKIWKGRHVAESTLTSRINAARKAVGDSGNAQTLIRTVARKGFRFVAAVQTGTEAAAPAEPAASHRDDGSQPVMPLGDRPGIAVLPFINMSGDRTQDYFSDGISEDIITALSKLRWFFVIARNSSFVYKGRSAHINEIARELGVRYVVEGSVRRSGDRVRISAQLNDVCHRQPSVGRALRSRSSPTCSPCRTRSPRRSLPRSSRISTRPRVFGRSTSLRAASMPGIS